jgi:hypothetical protein
MMETTVKRALKASHDIGDSTVDTAKDHLKVESKRFGGKWYWFLPGFDWEGWKKNQAGKGPKEGAKEEPCHALTPLNEGEQSKGVRE